MLTPEIVGTVLGFLILAFPFWKMFDRTGLPKIWLAALRQAGRRDLYSLVSAGALAVAFSTSGSAAMSLSIWHIVLLFIVLFLPQLPALWVLKKAGWSRWHFLPLAIPLVGIVWLYIFAFGKWRAEAS